jgi:hypothetical protein
MTIAAAEHGNRLPERELALPIRHPREATRSLAPNSTPRFRTSLTVSVTMIDSSGAERSVAAAPAASTACVAAACTARDRSRGRARERRTAADQIVDHDRAIDVELAGWPPLAALIFHEREADRLLRASHEQRGKRARALHAA